MVKKYIVIFEKSSLFVRTTVPVSKTAQSIPFVNKVLKYHLNWDNGENIDKPFHIIVF